jgi:hypothetical protein
VVQTLPFRHRVLDAKGQEFHTQNKVGYPRFTARRRGGLHQFTVEFRTLALSCVFLFDDPLKAT